MQKIKDKHKLYLEYKNNIRKEIKQEKSRNQKEHKKRQQNILNEKNIRSLNQTKIKNSIKSKNEQIKNETKLKRELNSSLISEYKSISDKNKRDNYLLKKQKEQCIKSNINKKKIDEVNKLRTEKIFQLENEKEEISRLKYILKHLEKKEIKMLDQYKETKNIKQSWERSSEMNLFNKPKLKRNNDKHNISVDFVKSKIDSEASRKMIGRNKGMNLTEKSKENEVNKSVKSNSKKYNWEKVDTGSNINNNVPNNKRNNYNKTRLNNDRTNIGLIKRNKIKFERNNSCLNPYKNDKIKKFKAFYGISSEKPETDKSNLTKIRVKPLDKCRSRSAKR